MRKTNKSTNKSPPSLLLQIDFSDIEHIQKFDFFNFHNRIQAADHSNDKKFSRGKKDEWKKNQKGIKHGKAKDDGPTFASLLSPFQIFSRIFLFRLLLILSFFFFRTSAFIFLFSFLNQNQLFQPSKNFD